MPEQINLSYPVLPLRDIVVFPHMIVPLFVGRDKSVRALEVVMANDQQILLSSQIDPGEDDPSSEGIYKTGVLANVLQLLKLPDGTVKVLVEGQNRVKITRFLDTESYFEAEVSPLSEMPGDAATTQALVRTVSDEFERYAKVRKNIPEEALAARFAADRARDPPPASSAGSAPPLRGRTAHPERIKVVDLQGTQLRFWRRKIASGAGLNEAAQRQLEARFGPGAYQRAMDAGSIEVLLEPPPAEAAEGKVVLAEAEERPAAAEPDQGLPREAGDGRDGSPPSPAAETAAKELEARPE